MSSATKPPEISEKVWSAQFIQLARTLGWSLTYHTLNSYGSAKGFPDWVLCRAGQLCFVELKSEKGKVKPEQQAWIDMLNTVPGVSAHLFRPSDFEEAARILGHRLVKVEVIQ
jgi:hypothetical protein